MTAMGRTDGTHQGDRVPFWLEACDDDRRNACDRVVQIEGVFCADDSGWSCNELGGHYLRGEIVAPDSAQALSWFARACRLRFQAGCVNLLEPGTFSRTVPKVLDLRLLLREGGQDLTEMSEPELYTRACEHGWTFACDRVGRP
jgi:TPR repeat protein